MKTGQPSGRVGLFGFQVTGISASDWGSPLACIHSSMGPSKKHRQFLATLWIMVWLTLWCDFNLERFWKGGHNCNYTWPHWVPLLLLPMKGDGLGGWGGGVLSFCPCAQSISCWASHSLPQHLPTHSWESWHSVFGLTLEFQALRKGKEILLLWSKSLLLFVLFCSSQWRWRTVDYLCWVWNSLLKVKFNS